MDWPPVGGAAEPDAMLLSCGSLSSWVRRFVACVGYASLFPPGPLLHARDELVDCWACLLAAAAAAAPTRLAVGWSYLCLSDWLYAVAVMKFVASVISVWNGYLALSRRRDCCY